MQDIDFDELDRAVSSVSTPTTDGSTDTPTPTPIPAPAPDSTNSPSPAARRSSGRFMDVVHPSSDMRSSSVPERSVPREEPQKPDFNLHVDERPEEKPTDAAAKEWPDPLDFHGFNMDETPSATPVTAPEPQTPVVPEEAKEETPQPLESPFLSGTKVEKRPLGGFPSAEPMKTETPTEVVEEKTEVKPAEPEEELLLEAPEAEPLLEAVTPEPETTPETPVSTPPVEATPEPAPEPTPPVVAEEPVGPTSITQQYKEQPSTADQPSGAIYDTEAYHQALTHTPKKKSGALVVVWIAALILVGAGAGAAVYFFVLPML